MALPKLEAPTYTTTLPSTGKDIKFRPFLVKEEKVILIALQENDPKAMLDAVKQIVENCTFKAYDVNKLTNYDLEWLFLQVRIKSKGNIVDLQFRCKNQIMDNDTAKDCDELITFQYDLNDAEIIGKAKNNQKIILDESKQIGIILKHPTFEATERLIAAMSEDNDDIFGDMIYDYVDTIFEGDNVYEDFSKKEFAEWIESMNKDQFGAVKDFFDDVPKLGAKIDIKCPKCGNQETVEVYGLSSFLV